MLVQQKNPSNCLWFQLEMLDGYFGYAAWPGPCIDGTAEYTEIDNFTTPLKYCFSEDFS